MSLSRIFSRLTASAIIATVGFSAMFVSLSIPAESSSGDTGVHFGLSAAFAASGATTPAAGTTTDPKKSTLETFGDNVVKGSNFVLEILYAFLIPLTLLAGWLLSPDWTFGDIFGLRTVIHSLWILVSNVVYIVFAFSLVAIAFVNIYSGGGNFAIKKALPRFLIGVLIVPFTWFIVSATLSVSNVLTASVLRLPYDMMTPEQRSYDLKIPKTCTLKFDEKDPKTAGKIFTCSKDTNSIKLGDFISGGKSTYNIVTAYAYSVFSIDTLKDLSKNKIDSVQSMLNGGIQLIVGIISFIVFALLLLALCFALFTRAFHMWVMAIFSPLFGLFYFFEGKGKLAELDKQIGFKTFLGLAMVPVYVAAALSFGLLFLTMTQNVDLSKSISASSYWQDAKAGNDGSSTFSIGHMANGNPVMDIKVEWQPLFVQDATAGVGTAVKLGQNAIGKIIISVLGIVVLWMAMMAALHGSDITKAAVEPIEGFGKSIADMAKAIPQNTPMLPIGWGMSMKWLKQFGDGMVWGINQSSSAWWGAGTEFGSKLMGKEQSKEMQEQNDLIRKLPNAQAQATKDAMESVLAKSGVKDGKISDPTQREQVAKAVEGHNKDLFMKDVDVDKIKKEAAAKIRAGDITGGLSLLENSLRREARFKGGEDGHVNVNELDELAKKWGSAGSENAATPAAGGTATGDAATAAVWTKEYYSGKIGSVPQGKKAMTIDMGNKKINIPEGHHISKALLTEIESAVGAEDDASKNALKEALTGKGFTLD